MSLALAFKITTDEIPDIAALRALDAPESTTAAAYVCGYYSQCDGGGGRFSWDAASVLDDDGGAVIRPTGVAAEDPGRWVREASTRINVRLFGATPGIDDLGARINTINAYLGAVGGEIVVPDGDWTINTKIALSAHRTLRLGRGTYTSHVVDEPTISLGPGWSGDYADEPVFASNISIIGSGWGTIITETDGITNENSHGYHIISADNRNDTGQSEYGNYLVSDLQLLGRPENGRNGTLSTVNFANAKNVIFTRVCMRQTRSLGVVLGGSAQATGQHADNVWITDCLFDDVAQQPVAPVNSSNVHVNRNTFRVGPNSYSLALVDFETNTYLDLAENFEVSDNIFDCRGGTFVGGGIFGIQVIGNYPGNVNGQRVGPGMIHNNVWIGTQFPPETQTDSESLSTPFYIVNARDIEISHNNLRFCGKPIFDGCERIDFKDNRTQSGPPLTLLNSSNCSVTGNRWVYGTTFFSSLGTLEEIGDSDYNIVANNTFSPPNGTETQTIVTVPRISLVGAHSREYNNYFGGLRYGLEDVDTNLRRGHVTFDGFGLDLIDSTAGSELFCNGQGYVPADRKTSDNAVTLNGRAAPASFQALSSPDEVGVIFHTTQPGYLTAVRFYKHASDVATSHDWNLWIYGSTIIREGTFGVETASGWQEAALDPPVAVRPGVDYLIAYTSGAGGFGYTAGAFASEYTSSPLVVGASGARRGVPDTNPGTVTDVNYFADVVFHVGKVRAQNALESTLATTAATDVVTVLKPQMGNYLVAAYYRVVVGASDVLIVATWTDASGAQSATLATAAAQPIGSYPVPPLFLNVAPGAANLKITATASVAGRVVVSATATLL